MGIPIPEKEWKEYLDYKTLEEFWDKKAREVQFDMRNYQLTAQRFLQASNMVIDNLIEDKSRKYVIMNQEIVFLEEDTDEAEE